MERLLIAKGRGVATNVPENELIKLVRIRPLLYDKKAGDYRKPGVSENAWAEVANVLNTSVVNVKKRWKSLRDTFIKYYRIEHQQLKNHHKDIKKRRWHFYNQLKFLQPHVELFRLEENRVIKDETLPIYLKEGDFLDEKQFFFKSDSPEGDAIRYQIKINDDQEYEVTEENLDEDHLLESFTEEPVDNEHSRIDLVNAEVLSNANDKSNEPQPSQYVLLEEPNDEEEEVELPISNKKSIPASPTPSISQETCQSTDPDERYLLSCLPAFKRFTPQQKALVRMGIERLFYEVEFEPASKKFKA